MKYTIEVKEECQYPTNLPQDYLDRHIQSRFADEFTKAILEKTHVQKTDNGSVIMLKSEVILISSIQFDDIMENLQKLMDMAKGNCRAENSIKDVRNILLR